MKTKFFLHGGNANHINLQNDSFFKDILEDLPKNITILLVYFAKYSDKVSLAKTEDIKQFESNKGSKNLTFLVADEDNFIEQIKLSDVIYIHGGKTLKLLEVLKNYSNLKRYLKGKVIVGESAGAYVLSTRFFSKTEKGLFSGLGLVPVKIICHYIGRDNDKLPKDDNLSKLLLADYEYKIFLI